MPRPSKGEWDTPGGPGGQEAVEEIERRRGRAVRGAARALYGAWQDAVAELADGRVFKSTVKPEEFNSFRRTRLDEGITDAQLVESFKAFATGVLSGRSSVRHRDLWRAYAAQWARWVSDAPAPTQAPLRDRQGPPRQR